MHRACLFLPVLKAIFALLCSDSSVRYQCLLRTTLWGIFDDRKGALACVEYAAPWLEDGGVAISFLRLIDSYLDYVPGKTYL